LADALANLLNFAGYRVTREYYINDAGAQVDVLAPFSFSFVTAKHWAKISAKFRRAFIPGDYLKPVGLCASV